VLNPAHGREARAAANDVVEGNPHLFLPDGTDVHNLGIEEHWEGEARRGFPVVDKDDPAIFMDLLERAAS